LPVLEGEAPEEVPEGDLEDEPDLEEEDDPPETEEPLGTLLEADTGGVPGFITWKVGPVA